MEQMWAKNLAVCSFFLYFAVQFTEKSKNERETVILVSEGFTEGA